MVLSNSQITVLEVVYEGIYEDYIKVEIMSAALICSELSKRELKVYRLSVGGALQGKRVAKMKQSPRVSVPPAWHDGDLPREFEEEVRSQLGRL